MSRAVKGITYLDLAPPFPPPGMAFRTSQEPLTKWRVIKSDSA